MKEKRTTYLQLKENVKSGVVAAAMFGRGEPVVTCRIAVNIGIECLIAGIEFLKAHGIPKRLVLEFVERLFDKPGDIEGMEKGGPNEHLLRSAMQMINGAIVRHTPIGDVVEGDSHDDVDDVVVPQGTRRLNNALN